MTTQFDKEDPREYLAQLSRQDVCDGVAYEPRILFDDFDFDAGGVNTVRCEPDAFINGEERPMRITHVVAAMGRPPTDASPAPALAQGDERLIQRFAMRVITHDTFYMSPKFVPFPLWHNCRNAAAAAVSRGNGTWHFAKPFALSQRDTFIVDLTLESVPASARICGATFSGIGRTSKRPVRFTDSVQITDTTTVQLDPSALRSQGAEVVDIHSMSLHCGGPIDGNDASGDLQQLRAAVRQLGNGTNEQWESGPAVGVAGADAPPALLWAPDTGRAVVHRLPNPWTFQPDQGVELVVQALDTTRQATISDRVWVGLLGYTIIT